MATGRHYLPLRWVIHLVNRHILSPSRLGTGFRYIRYVWFGAPTPLLWQKCHTCCCRYVTLWQKYHTVATAQYVVAAINRHTRYRVLHLNHTSPDTVVKMSHCGKNVTHSSVGEWVMPFLSLNTLIIHRHHGINDQATESIKNWYRSPLLLIPC